MKTNCKLCLDGHCNECINENCFCRENKHYEKPDLEKAADLFLGKISIDQLKNACKQVHELELNNINSDKDEFGKDSKGGFHAYEEKNSMQYFAKDFVSNIMLPAHTYNGKESCGKWKLIGCLEGEMHNNGEGYAKKTIQRCNNKGCRVCATSSIKREAKSITNRLMTFCNLKRNRKIYLKENRSRILLHVVLSSPYEQHSFYLTRDGRKKLRQDAIKILNKFDIDGGVQIDHPYRFSKGLESARFSPHFHFILTGWLDGQIVKEVYEKTNWIVTNVSNLESWNDCYNLSKYLLSHAAVFMKEENKRSAEHSVRYFGECHNKKFKVQEVLKYSVTGFDQLESILFQRRELEKKNEIIPLQRVHYTHSMIDDDYVNSKGKKSLGFIDSKFEEDAVNVTKSLRRFIDADLNNTKDNPAFPQSELSSMEFLQMRFEYGYDQYNIVQSVYVSIIFDRSIDELCPCCTAKMKILAPPNVEWKDYECDRIVEFINSIPEDEKVVLQSIDDFVYLNKESWSYLPSLPYFDFDGKLGYESGIYQRPECLGSLNPKLYWGIIKNIEIQKMKYSFKLQNGRSPTKDELQEILNPPKIYKTKSQTLKKFMVIGK